MNELNRLVARHKTAARIIISIIYCAGISLVLFLLEASVWAIIVVDLFMILIAHFFVISCQNKLIQSAYKKLDEACDPYPLLAETTELLTYKNSESVRQLILIDHCVALRQIGRFDQAFEMLSSINIDKFSGTLPAVKVVYYNNLADICTLLGHFDSANMWHFKMMQIYSDMKDSRQKRRLEPTIKGAIAFDCFRKGDYVQTLQILGGCEQPSLCHKVDDAMLYAKACICLGDTQTAREWLRFVVANGNRLCFVELAQRMLDGLPQA